MNVKNTFIGGRMNKDLDERLVPEGEYIHAENLRFLTPDGSNSGSARFSFGNKKVSTFSFPVGSICIGHAVDRLSKFIYYLVRTPTGAGYVMEFDSLNGITDTVLVDTRPTGDTFASNKLNFQDSTNPVAMSIFNDVENGKKFLFISDDFNEPRYFEVGYAKTLPASFQERAISLVKAPPLEAPGITLTSANTELENNLDGKFLSFAYRYKYANGEYSAMSPISNHAFKAKTFDYDYTTSTNNSMVNTFREANINIQTSNSEVTDIQLLFKEAGNSSVYIIEEINKEEEGWNNNSNYIVSFSNNKTYGELPEDQLNRFYDNVPIKAKAMELISNRLVFGNYSEGYDMLDDNGNKVVPRILLANTSTISGMGNSSYETVKSNREYEVGIAYLDGKGRITTPFTNIGNTHFIENSESDKINKLQVTITTRAPEFATHYRFFLKQPKTSYFTIASLENYSSSDDLYVQIQSQDINKIKQGDFVFLKQDDTGIRNPPPRLEVLEVELKGANFLGGTQEAGLYFKIGGADVNNVANGLLLFETDPIDINSDVFFELADTYPIVDSLHIGKFGDQDQTLVQNAVIELDFFNAFGWANGFESNRILDSFNGDEMTLDTRPAVPIEDYRQIRRTASLTYSGVYENTTGYNALNEFNLSNANFKDMDTQYGGIQKLFSKDTDLYVFQEDKTHRVLYQKDVLFDADGQGNIRESTKVLGQEIPYTGEYGISRNPESFAIYGNNIYHLDKKRGALLRLGRDGYTEISQNGMHDYFRTMCRDNTQEHFFGGYNPFDDMYTINVSSTQSLTYSEKSKGFTSFYSFAPEAMMNVDNKFYSIKNGEVYEHDNKDVVPNSFYSTVYPSRIHMAMNESMSDIKVTKSISLEGSRPWATTIRAFGTDESDFVESTILEDEYVKKEGKWFSYVRRNELSGDVCSKSVYGLGQILFISGNTITLLRALNSSISAGDEIYNENSQLIGVVESIGSSGNNFTVDNILTGASNQFIYGQKDQRIEGSHIRGYSSVLELETTPTEKGELFAVNSEVIKSYQ